MLEAKKGQIAVEYLILTAFILTAVAILFAFSFLNYSQNIRIAQANEALSKLANAVDDVYLRGEGNNRFVNVYFPDGMSKLEIVHKCTEAGAINQGTVSACSGGPEDYDFVEFSVIRMKVKLLAGESILARETKATIFENIGEMSAQNPNNPNINKYSGSGYTVKVSWNDAGQIKMQKV